jgi:hypothetical protein
MRPTRQAQAVGLEEAQAERLEVHPVVRLAAVPASGLVRQEGPPVWALAAVMGWETAQAAPMPAPIACQIHPVTA